MSLGKIVGEKPSQYKIGTVIGQGAFSTVYQCVRTDGNETFAVKVISKQALRSDAELEDALCREINAMQVMRPSEFVVQLHDTLVSPRNYYLVMDLVNGGNLMQQIQRSGKGLYPNQARLYFRQLLRGLGAIHGSGVVHRDIKPENLLLDVSHSILKISDFGFACYSPPGRELRRKCGTLRYSAPEIFTGETYHGRDVDIWAAGVTLYVMLFNAYPFHVFPAKSSRYRQGPEPSMEQRLVERICAGTYDLPRRFSSSLEHLLGAMLRVDPKQRWTLEKIRNHAWVMGIDELTLRIPKQVKPRRPAVPQGESPLSSSPAFTPAGNEVSDSCFLLNSSLLNADDSDSDVEYIQGGSHRRVRSCPTLPTFLAHVMDPGDFPLRPITSAKTTTVVEDVFPIADEDPLSHPSGGKLPCIASEVSLDDTSEPRMDSRATTASLGRPMSLSSFGIPDSGSQPQSPAEGMLDTDGPPSSVSPSIAATTRIRPPLPPTAPFPSLSYSPGASTSTPPLSRNRMSASLTSSTPTHRSPEDNSRSLHDAKRFEQSLFLKRFGMAHLRIAFNFFVFCTTLVIVGSLRVLFAVDALKLPLPKKAKDLLEQFLKPPFEQDDIQELSMEEVETPTPAERRSPTPLLVSPRLRTKGSTDSIQKQMDGLRRRAPQTSSSSVKVPSHTPPLPQSSLKTPFAVATSPKRVRVQEQATSTPLDPVECVVSTPALPFEFTATFNGTVLEKAHHHEPETHFVPTQEEQVEDDRQLLKLHCDASSGVCFAVARMGEGEINTKVSSAEPSSTASPMSLSPPTSLTSPRDDCLGVRRSLAKMRAVASHADLADHEDMEET